MYSPEVTTAIKYLDENRQSGILESEGTVQFMEMMYTSFRVQYVKQLDNKFKKFHSKGCAFSSQKRHVPKK